MIKDESCLETASHIPVLTAVVLRTVGPILEFGCGYYSTLLLHEVARINKRLLVTAENNWEWFSTFLYLRTNWHLFEFVMDWSEFRLPLQQEWDVVFIDHEPALRRKVDIRLLRRKAKYIVVHDSNRELYEYKEVFGTFKYRFDYTLLEPWTTVLSNFYDLKFLEGSNNNESSQ